MMNKLINVKETAKLLKMHPETIRKLCREGRLPATRPFKEWLIDKEKLLKMIGEE